MSQPLTDQRPRAELIAELYDRHAAGLFAYCADQLGDLGSASDVLMTVLSAVPDTEPPRAALYALSRRQIHRRDVVYTPPAVDPLIDPATALVERTLRELRPHQREVLVLCAVCGLSKDELAWVLDVAPDTARELAVGAGRRFRQALGAALASAGARVPKPVADVYGALAVAPLRDVLGRLPWPAPPGGLRIHFAGSRTAAPGPLFVKPRWPSPPMWPQPLAEADPATSTMIFPKELLTPPSRARVPEHEATTAPMPKLRGGPGFDRPLRDPLAAFDPARPLSAAGAFGAAGSSGARGTGPQPGERPFFLAAPGDEAEPFATGDVLLPKDSPEPFATGDVLLPDEAMSPPPFSPGGPTPSGPSPGGMRRPPRRPRPASADDDILVHKGPPRPLQRPPHQDDDPARDTAPLFTPRPKPAEPVYRMPPAWEDARTPAPKPKGPKEPRQSKERRESRESILAPRPVRGRPVPKRRPDKAIRPEKKRRRRERRFDWMWELIGFLICVAIAMIVFFSVPMFFDP